MYEQFFQLERRPFAATPDPACFFRCESISHVLDQLTVSIEHGQGIGILTSPAGMGKTLICQRLVKELGERFRMIFLGNSNFPTRRSLLQAILFETGVEFSRKDEQELRHELRNVLRDLRKDYESVVLIVDEAHSFEAELLEEIRTLVDLGDEGHSLVRVILSGQLELEERMTDRRFDAINQRISTHVYLEPLSIAESIGYLRHRVEWAGADPDGVFSGDAETIIARASCGVPRCLNQLADHSLLLGFAADESPVQEATVREALEDLKQLPLHWNDVNDADRMIASQMESDEAEADELSDEFSEIEDAWEAESGFAEESAEVAHETRGDEHEDELTEVESHEVSAEDEAEEAAPLAVFEFGADDIEDSPLDDHDEGDTLDEVAATIDVAEVATGEEAEATHEAPQEAAAQPGQPSPPVSEISGVVLDLSSQVCGVSECVDGVAEFGGKSQDESTQTESCDAEASLPASDAEFGAGLDLTEQSESHAQGEETAAHGESTVFEFGAEDEADHAQEEHSESAEQSSMEDTSEGHAMPEDVPSEEEVLAEVSSVENDIADFEAELHQEDSPEDGHHEEGHHEGAHVEDVPTEEEVLTEIAQVEAEIAQVVWDEEVASEESGDSESAKVSSEACAALETAQEEPQQESHGQIGHHEDASPVSDAASSRFETEVVADPYSVIEEPLAAGIVWDVPSEADVDVASSQEIPDDEHAEPEHEEEVCQVSHDSHSHPEETQEDGEHSQSEEHCEIVETETVQLEEAAKRDEELHDDSHIASQIELEEAIYAPLSDPVTEELSEAIMQDWSEAEADEAAELDVVEEPTAELSLFAEEHREEHVEEEIADADLDPAREIHPDRYIEAIVPMLGEIEELCAKEFKADSPERDAVDIEAELVDAISGDNPDVEDEIGATVLDICLDAQWAIQQDGERTEELNESARPFAEAEVESESEGYDIVEPEFPPETYFTSQVSELGKPDVSAPASDRSSDRRPFGRLFSDLRRRDS